MLTTKRTVAGTDNVQEKYQGLSPTGNRSRWKNMFIIIYIVFFFFFNQFLYIYTLHYIVIFIYKHLICITVYAYYYVMGSAWGACVQTLGTHEIAWEGVFSPGVHPPVLIDVPFQTRLLLSRPLEVESLDSPTSTTSRTCALNSANFQNCL